MELFWRGASSVWGWDFLAVLERGWTRVCTTRDVAVFFWRGFWVPLELKRLCHSCLFLVSWMSSRL